MLNLSFAFCIVCVVGTLSVFVFALTKHHRRKRRREVGFEEIIPFLTPANLAALLELTRPQQETYIRSRVTASEFRAIQRRQLRLLIETTKRILRNSGLLQDLAAGHLYTCNPLMAEIAEELIDVGAMVRMYSFLVLLRLYLRKAILALGPFAFPTHFADFEKTVAINLIPTYEDLKSKAAGFAILRSAGFVELLMHNL